MEELSPKEVLLSIIAILIAITLAIFINPFIKDAFLEDIREYQQALQIDGDANQFQYAQLTKVGNVFAYGRMKSVHPVSLPELLGNYSMIEKVTEEYTMHTRLVCNGYDDEGNCTSHRTETYYTWDFEDRDTFISDYFDFLSVPFHFSSLDIETQGRLKLSQGTVSQPFLGLVEYNYIYEENDWWSSAGDLRYYYEVLPTEFNASMFSNFNVDVPVHAKVYYEKNKEQVLLDKESKIKSFDFMYYTLWLLIIGGGYFYWAYHHGEIE